ncbi:5-formyltetrahydrofolate cyclo-ligase [Derxia lacustris]|uniref:5-formyltetrahydrofolate cyclo-ligase n=1 Tax=Derxia lacustris TaxID=764842 RepID=UPI0015946E54|nr:5-formyltetrahydrofolate cyclo-ligase [Derxia lacustris]
MSTTGSGDETTLARRELRQLLLKKRAEIPAEARLQAEAAIARNAFDALLALAGARGLQGLVVSAYLPIRGEPVLDALWQRLLEAGARLALPVVVEKAAPMVFREWDGAEPTGRDALGLAVPAADVRVTPEVLVIPCVGFDPAGWRLGYGGGYYDRTLERLVDKGAKSVGVGFELSALDLQPALHDIRLHFICSEARLIDEQSAHKS